MSEIQADRRIHFKEKLCTNLHISKFVKFVNYKECPKVHKGRCHCERTRAQIGLVVITVETTQLICVCSILIGMYVQQHVLIRQYQRHLDVMLFQHCKSLCGAMPASRPCLESRHMRNAKWFDDFFTLLRHPML